MTPSKNSLLSWTCRIVLLGLAVSIAACSSKPKKMKGVPSRLPDIHLSSSPATPPHRLSSYEYPFDSSGNYITAWAADGERRYGRSAATRTDVAAWSNSHRKAAPPLNKPTKLKSTASTTKRSSSSSRNTSRSKRQVASSRSSSKSKTSTKSRSSSYTVRKGDTLSAIARRNGTTVAKLKAANGLRSDNIGIGKTLRIPR